MENPFSPFDIKNPFNTYSIKDPFTAEYDIENPFDIDIKEEDDHSDDTFSIY